MQKVFAILLLGCLAAFATSYTETDYQEAFINFCSKFSKTYRHDEFAHRYGVFRSNMDYVKSFNARKTGMILAINEFADLTNTEFNQMYLGYKQTEFPQPVADNVTRVDLPAEWNWVPKGAVTGIKNQGQCGSCWSFSTTGSLEGCHQISGKPLVGLSEQNLMDCSTKYGNEGCDGGLMTAAMEYIINNKGIDTEASYPYTAEDGKCHYKTANIGATMTSYVNVQSGSESDLQAKVAVGPVSVAIDASHNSFQLYSSGVYYEPACSSTQLDHGVLAVGWGVDGSKDYWIVKNSWGTSWGMSGYIWMSRNRNNNCGIATQATLPKC